MQPSLCQRYAERKGTSKTRILEAESAKKWKQTHDHGMRQETARGSSDGVQGPMRWRPRGRHTC